MGCQLEITEDPNRSALDVWKRVQELERELATRDQVIGELTIANRIFKKLSDGSL